MPEVVPGMEQSLHQKVQKLMVPENGYEGATQADVKIMRGENEHFIKTLMKFYRNPEERLAVLQEELAKTVQTRARIAEGDPKVFEGTDGSDTGYYSASNDSPTGSMLMGPGGPGWNPNRASMNLLMRQEMLEAAIGSLSGGQ